ncbi:ATPase subunit 1 [Cucumis melo var. makuwa]|uniref:ATPase subunit 1 (Mitochondrion) n=1 Tax=Cucumis melo var. makuwa TaxID=1194695 RepID=A0A5A7UFT5_CUCMM|nr:ATPase subunit 1 [Cucumis melo var. makuwa]TYK27765.1 ATPase subunit 1 [Cucumis melo var. makuwa]
MGQVLSVEDGIMRVYGLKESQVGEMVEFASGVKGIALNLNNENAMLERVVNALGVAINGREALNDHERRRVKVKAPVIIEYYAFEKLDLDSLELKVEVAKRKDGNSILFGSMLKTNERGKRHLKSKKEDQSLDQCSIFPKECERSRAQRGLFWQFHPFQLLSQFFLKKKFKSVRVRASVKAKPDQSTHLAKDVDTKARLDVIEGSIFGWMTGRSRRIPAAGDNREQQEVEDIHGALASR